MFYIVESGKFISLKKEKNIHEKIMREFKEGDVFGESCLYSQLPSAESIMSLVTNALHRPTENSTPSRRTGSKESSDQSTKS